MSFAQRLHIIQSRIAIAAMKAGRNPASVTLAAVAKQVDALRIDEAYKAGQRVFAENYVQEAKGKWTALKDRFKGIQLHLIGHLQSNKAEDAVALFDRIDTLDKPKLAAALAAAMRHKKRHIPVLIEVNIAAEAQKSGCLPQDAPALLKAARDLGLKVHGLMCIPPLEGDPAPHFKKLKALADQLGLSVVSMGMSADFEEAITCGATEVRIGTALFGPR